MKEETLHKMVRGGSAVAIVLGVLLGFLLLGILVWAIIKLTS